MKDPTFLIVLLIFLGLPLLRAILDRFAKKLGQAPPAKPGPPASRVSAGPASRVSAGPASRAKPAARRGGLGAFFRELERAIQEGQRTEAPPVEAKPLPRRRAEAEAARRPAAPRPPARPEVEPAVPPPQAAAEAEGHLEHVRVTAEEAGVIGLGARGRAAAGRSGRLPVFPAGAGIRSAVLASIVLGPPVAHQRRRFPQLRSRNRFPP